MPTAIPGRNSRAPRRAARPRLEALEPRLALAASATLGAAARVAIVGDTLTVEGTPGPDRIRILPTQLPGTVRVAFDGKMLGSYGPVASIDVNAGAGNDTVTVDPRITLPTVLDGGEGNDRLQGGSGPNFLDGGAGRNTLIGNPIRDTFDDSSGQNRLVFLKSLGMIQVGPSTPGAALRRLSGAYALRPLRLAGPAVVGAADLRNGRIANQLRRDYNGGQAVALANARATDTAALARLLGVPNPPAFPAGVNRAELIVFRKTVEDGRAVFSTSILPTANVAATPANVAATPAQRAAGRRAAARAVRAYLEKAFSAPPNVPTLSQVGDAPPQLTQIASQYQQSSLDYDKVTGRSLQINNTVYDVRSFDSEEDFYLVVQELDDQSGTDPYEYVGALSVAAGGFHQTTGGVAPDPLALTLTQPSPQSNPGTTSYTSGVSLSVGGSFGVNEAQGLNASVNASLTISNSQTVTVPPIQISYQGDPATGQPFWFYFFSNPQPTGASSTFYNTWVWRVPFSSYPDKDQNSSIYLVSYGFYKTVGDPNQHNNGFAMFVPKPFGTTYQLAKPVVDAVSQETVRPGDVFSIEGSGFYPSLVQSVLIGGQPLAPTNFKVVSDHEIQVVAPDTPGTGKSVVVGAGKYFSNNDVTINIQG